jgi:hypothetical protein
MATSFSGGGNWSPRREPPTMDKQLISFITCGCESSAPFLNPRSTTLERLRKLLQLVMQCGCVELICARFCICISITYFFNEYSSSVGWARYSLCLQCELTHFSWGPRVAQWVRSLDITILTSQSPIRARLCKLQKGCTRLAAASDKSLLVLQFTYIILIFLCLKSVHVFTSWKQKYTRLLKSSIDISCISHFLQAYCDGYIFPRLREWFYMRGLSWRYNPLRTCGRISASWAVIFPDSLWLQ